MSLHGKVRKRGHESTMKVECGKMNASFILKMNAPMGPEKKQSPHNWCPARWGWTPKM
jgi:hypothetical protein